MVQESEKHSIGADIYETKGLLTKKSVIYNNVLIYTQHCPK